MNIRNTLTGLALLATSSTLFAQAPVDLRNSPDINCKKADWATGSVYTFAYNAGEELFFLMIHGDIKAQVMNDKGENLDFKHGNDIGTGEPHQMLVISEAGQYTVTIESGGAGSVCLNMPK